MSGGQKQSSASAKKRGVRTHTHSTPRQPRKSNAQAVPEDVSVAFTVQSAHAEAPLVQSALPAHGSLSVPAALQGAVRL